MAVKKVYIGSVGPFLYDDTNLINDPDGDFVGETCKAVTSDGDVLTNNSVRKEDFNAYTILAADVDNTPAIVTINEEQILGRKTGEGITAFAMTDILAKILCHEGNVIVHNGEVVWN